MGKKLANNRKRCEIAGICSYPEEWADCTTSIGSCPLLEKGLSLWPMHSNLSHPTEVEFVSSCVRL
eukprot:3247922-Amphidinium_carterae.1